MLRRGAFALLLLVVALHPLAHEESFDLAPELTLQVEHHDTAECPCIRGGTTDVAAPELAERLALQASLVEATRDGYTSADPTSAIPPRAPPVLG